MVFRNGVVRLLGADGKDRRDLYDLKFLRWQQTAVDLGMSLFSVHAINVRSKRTGWPA